MPIDDLASEAASFFPANPMGSMQLAEPGPGLQIHRYGSPSAMEATLYTPSICLLLQGCKEVVLGDQTFAYRAGECMVVSHTLPVTTRVIEAKEDSPFLALVAFLNVESLRGLQAEIAATGADPIEAQSIEVSRPAPAIVNSLARLVELSRSPAEAPILGPLVWKELHFHVLRAPNTGMLRALLSEDSPPSGVTRAIEMLRENFAEPVNVSHLAKHVGMSSSSLHAHFRSITGTTPLQFQKNLRLLEARRLLIEERCAVKAAAIRVGYESLSQFSRAYSRKFGIAPSIDRTEHSITSN